MNVDATAAAAARGRQAGRVKTRDVAAVRPLFGCSQAAMPVCGLTGSTSVLPRLEG